MRDHCENLVIGQRDRTNENCCVKEGECAKSKEEEGPKKKDSPEAPRRRDVRTQHSSPDPWAPLSVQVFKLNAARVSWPTTTAIWRMASLSNVAAHDGPDGNEVEHRPSEVQLASIDEWIQFCPLQVQVEPREQRSVGCGETGLCTLHSARACVART